MRRRVVCALLVFLLIPALASGAEPIESKNPFFSTSSGLGGFFVYGGVAAWPKQTGIGLSLGLFHQYRFGFDVSINLPLVKRVQDPGPFVLSALTGRLVLLREGLTEAWTEGKPPTVGLIVGLRAGMGLLDNVGMTGGPVSFLIGPTVELLIGRTLLFGIRPSVGVRSARKPEDPSRSGLEALPVLDVSLGWISESAYSR